jgi:hypothetical protein
MTSLAVPLDDPPLLLEQFLTGYWTARTRTNYVFIIGGWCRQRPNTDPLTPIES